MNGWAFLQPILQLRNEGGGLRNGNSCAKGWFRSYETTCEKGVRLRKWEFLGVEDFVSISQLRNGTGVPNGCFVERGMRLRNHFTSNGRFRSGYLGATKLFRSQGPFSQGPFLRIFLAFDLLLIPNYLLSISLQFLLILIIQKD